MLITKSRLKQIIKEELEADPALSKAIGRLADKIDSLDVSIDFLSAAIVGGDPIAISTGQRARGRAYKPTANVSAKLNENEYDSASCQDIEEKLEELKSNLDNSQDKLKNENEIDVLSNLLTIKGCKGSK
jgi:hypothetical protein